MTVHYLQTNSIRMLKLCDKSICNPPNVIFKPCMTQIIFPSEWKKENIVPIQKKATNSVFEQKFFERIIYNTMATYFIETNQISEIQ